MSKGGSHALGVSKATLWLWERGVHEPSQEHMPRVVEFLGYVPFGTCESLGERIRLYRMSLGLTHVEFGEKIGGDAFNDSQVGE